MSAPAPLLTIPVKRMVRLLVDYIFILSVLLLYREVWILMLDCFCRVLLVEQCDSFGEFQIRYGWSVLCR